RSTGRRPVAVLHRVLALPRRRRRRRRNRRRGAEAQDLRRGLGQVLPDRVDGAKEHPDGRLQGHPHLRRSPLHLRLPDGDQNAVSRRSAALLLAATLTAWVGPAASAEPPPIRVPPGFRAEVFAEGLGAARALAVDPAGAVLVSISNAGRVVALVPATTGPPRVVSIVTGLQLPHGLAFRDGYLYVAETGRVLRLRYDARTRVAEAPVTVVPDLPAGAHHWTRSIAFGPDGRLYVAIGSSCDVCREADARRAAILSYAVDGSDARVVATGLRNPVGLAFDPATGVLWTT